MNPTPDAADRVDYQYLINSLGKGGYNIHKLGAPNETEAWHGDWKTANTFATAGGISNAPSPSPA